MATLEQRLTDLLEAPVVALGFELWGIEFVRAGKHSTLRVFIDAEQGVTVEDCAEVSRQVGAPSWTSNPHHRGVLPRGLLPGLDRPLFKVAQFEKYVGQEAAVSLRWQQITAASSKA